MENKILNNNLEIKIKDVESNINSYIKWLNNNKKNKVPITISKEYLVKAHYHKEEGRGGYFAPESGTSEGQFLTLLGLLDVYEITKDKEILNLAKNIAQSTLVHLYGNNEIPNEEFNEEYIYSPHWLFNASNDEFSSEIIYYNKEVNFVNGVGSINTKYKAKRVFSVREMTGKLEWENPFSKIVGKEYEISEKMIKDNKIVIKLLENYSGKLLVVYSDLGGDKIQPSENYEAYPVWRKLLKGETSCAVDSIWWSYQCFKKLYEIFSRQ